jgi:hypothetical protein
VLGVKLRPLIGGGVMSTQGSRVIGIDRLGKSPICIHPAG